MAATVHIVQRMAPGGIETLVLDLACNDAAVRIVSLEGDAGALAAAWPRLAELSDRFVAFGKPPGLVPGLVTTLARQLKAWRAEAMVAHHIGPLLYGGLAARIAGLPVRVHVEHDGWHYEDRSRARLGRLIDGIVQPRKVAVSRRTAEVAGTALSRDLIEIIPNGVDLARFKPGDRQAARAALGLAPQGTLIGTVGRLTHVKGHDVLIEALVHLPPNFSLAIVGDGEERQALERQVKAHELSPRVHFLGQRDRPEAIYPAFDLLCLPSRAEGFPRALIEAQACGIPVVAADVGGVAEAVCPLTGRLVLAEDPIRLALALVTSLERPGRGNPRDFVDPKFSFDRTLAAYRDIASNQRALLAS